jgi:hypothetical protein
MPFQLHNPIGRKIKCLAQKNIGTHQQYQYQGEPGDESAQVMIDSADSGY